MVESEEHRALQAQALQKGGCSTVSKFRGTGMSAAFLFFVIGNPFQDDKRARNRRRVVVVIPPNPFAKLVYGGSNFSHVCIWFNE